MAIDPNQLEITSAQLAKLCVLASRIGKPASQILSEALEQYRSNQGVDEPPAGEETLFKKLDRNGLIGCLDGGPADLSTNSKYMEGFGA